MRKRILLGWILVWMSLAMGSAQADVRVAMIGSELTPSGEVALGLAEAAVSGSGDVELLDRSTINKVLREHNLLANGFAQSDDAVQLGKLLTVDLFVHVESIPEQKALAVVAFETAQGIRLLDEVIAGGNASELSEKLTVGIDRALTKWRAPAGQSTAIALMSVRNVDLPRSRNTECDSFGSLLERRLLGSPGVVVVERKRLQSLNRDHEITMERPKNRLLSAPVLLDLDVSQSGSEGGLQATAFLSSPKGAELGSVHAEGEALPALTEKLSTDILNLLKKSAAPPPAAPGLEAARFFRIARFWKAQERPDLALAAAESAFALDPTNSLMHVLLINALFTAANANLAMVRPDALACAARGMAMLRQAAADPAFPGPKQKRQVQMLESDTAAFLRRFGKAIAEVQNKVPFSSEEAATYADFCREWLSYSPFSPDAEHAASSWELLLFANEGSLFYYFSDLESAWRALFEQVVRWSGERMGAEKYDHTSRLMSALIQAGDPTLQSSPAAYPVRAELWQFFVENSNPVLRYYGRCGQLVDATRLVEDGNRYSVDEASRTLLNEIFVAIQGQPQTGATLREHLYTVALLTIRRSGRHVLSRNDHSRAQLRQQLPEMVGLFQAMLKAGDVRGMPSLQARLASAKYAGLDDLWRKTLTELDLAMTEAAGTLSPKALPEDVEKLEAFHNWVRDKLDTGRNLQPPAANVKIESIELIEPEGNFIGYAVIEGDGEGGAYVASISGNPSQILVQKWTQGSKKALRVGTVETYGPHRTEVTTRSFGEAMLADRIGGVEDISIGLDTVALAVADEGVFLFDRNLPSVERLHETTALPVTHPLSVEILGEMLYIGTDDGYLVSFNLDSRTGEVLVASSRKEKKSPFDDGSPVHISALFADAARGRIVFMASVIDAAGNLGGIWEYLPETGAFNLLVPWCQQSSFIWWCEKVGDHHFVIGDFWGKLIQFDMESDSLDVLSIGRHRKIRRITKLLASQSSAPPVPHIRQRIALIAPPFLLREGCLWTGSPWGRFSMETYQWEARLPFRKPDGTVQFIRPDIGMVPISDHQVLLAEQGQLWLMTTEGKP